MRDGRRQLASGEIISFLDQQAQEIGVAEARRARRREKEAFLRSVLGGPGTTAGATAAGAAAAGAAAARSSKDPKEHAAAAAANAAGRRPSRARRASEALGSGGGLAGKNGDGRGHQPRGWPYGTVCLPTHRRRRSGPPGGGSYTEEFLRSANEGCGGGGGDRAGDDAASDEGGGGGGGAAPAATADAARPGSPRGGAVSPDAGTARANDDSRANKTGESEARRRTAGHKETDGVGGGNAQSDKGSQDLQRGVPGDGTGAGELEELAEPVAPSPLVTSSVRVLDMGAVGSPA